jgi:hypothetical protein
MRNIDHVPGARAVGPFLATAWVTALVLGASGAQSAPSRLAELDPGSSYRLMFVTSTAVFSGFNDIARYDNFVQGLADATGSSLAGLRASYQAVISMHDLDAYDHIGGAFTTPVYSLDGVLVADGAADLWDGLLSAPVATDETGRFWDGGINVNTGTGKDGRRSVAPFGCGFGPVVAITGGVAGSITAWTSGSFEGCSTRPIYGISGTLTVPGGTAVPVPSTACLLLAAMAASAWAGRARRPT